VIHRGFLTPGEVAELVELWRKTPGFDVTAPRRTYNFHGCSAPIDLSLRVINILKSTVDFNYLDSFFLHYEAGQGCDAHVDARSFSRLNVLLMKPPVGGVFRLDGAEQALEVGDAVLFNPGKQYHAVSKVEEGERLIWSMGLGTKPSAVLQARNRMPTPG
jgi:hypothetical protein